MIKIKLRGRLGNQMFQFAFGWLQAKKLNTSFLMDINDQPWELQYFVLTPFYRLLQSNIGRKAFNFWQKRRGTAAHIKMDDCFFKYDYEGLPDNTYYSGFFQDYELYEKHLSSLRKLFQVRPIFRKVFEQRYLPVIETKKVIAISFRIGDYKQFDLFGSKKNGEDIIIPFDWYYNILSKLDLENAQIYCLSDDIEYVKANFSFKHPSIQFVNEDVITQLLILQHASVCILSNSTFAWWGGLLNTKADQIICPQYFLGFSKKIEVPPDIYPPDWVQEVVAV